MPAPLQESFERVQPALVIAALVPALLLGGNAQQLRAPLPPNTAPVPRATILIQQPVPVPGAFTWQPGRVRATNADPCRPVVVQANPPSAALVQPQALVVGRLARNENVQWPARPAQAQVNQPAIPGAITVQTYTPRDEVFVPQDKLSPTVAQVNQPPVPSASSILLGMVPRDPNIDQAARPVVPIVFPLGAPGAITRATSAPRDQVVAPPDRLAQTALVTGAQPLPVGRTQFVGIVHDGDRLAPVALVSGQQPAPAALALPIGQPRSTPTERLAPPILLAGVQPAPQACAAWVRPPRLSTAPPVVFLSGGTITGVGRSGTVSSPGTAGTI